MPQEQKNGASPKAINSKKSKEIAVTKRVNNGASSQTVVDESNASSLLTKGKKVKLLPEKKSISETFVNNNAEAADKQPTATLVDIVAKDKNTSKSTGKKLPKTSGKRNAQTTEVVPKSEKASSFPVVNNVIAPSAKKKTSSQQAISASIKGSKKVEPKTALKRISFQVKYSTRPGQSIYVTGNHPQLGSGDYSKAFALNYLNEDYWYGSLDLADDIVSPFHYNYFVVNADGSTSVDWGTDKIIEPNSYLVEEILLIDTWNSPGQMENSFFTQPFQEVLLKDYFTKVPARKEPKATHIFKVKAPIVPNGYALCVIGSVKQMGEWSSQKPLLMSRVEGEAWHSVSINLSQTSYPISYKYGLYNTQSKEFVQFENGNNRLIYEGNNDNRLTIVSDGFAGIPYLGFKGAGIAIPVFSLRSQIGFGVGEFNDLKKLADWAKATGMKLIQLLPVNDTTATHTFTDSYPYAAISAFALHPLYLHLPSVITKKNEGILAEMEESRIELNNKGEVDYVEVLAKKWQILKKVFPLQKEETFKSTQFESYFSENEHWLIPYAAFCYLREKNKTADFNQWPQHSAYHADDIRAWVGSPLTVEDDISLYYFVQFHLHMQLKEATDYAHAKGVVVKGDIPIGIYRYSCDAWQSPELYNMDMQAGAPPDDFAIKGQNWGFPTYNWHKMKEDGFNWWKARFNQMKYYFDAFRIDHILGFFRIWSIPLHAVEGIMGHFVPAIPIHINELTGRGISFNYNRFCKPFINSQIVSEIFGDDHEYAKATFLIDNGYGYYTLKPEFETQRKVEHYFQSLSETDHHHKLKHNLYDIISNVIFVESSADGQQYHFRISMESTSSFRFLDAHTQEVLKDLYLNYFFRRQDDFWAKEAMQKLPELKRSTNMLICGEDLGMVPECVSGIMKELAILSLEIQRMPKDPKREFFHPNDAPYLSVVTPSTHDMSTIRGWWEENRETTQRFFNKELGQWGTAPYFCEPWICRNILLQHFHSPAMWSIFQMQDLMSISATLRRENPAEERINIPADPRHYWRYRMHISLEDLLQESGFNAEIKELITNSGR